MLAFTIFFHEMTTATQHITKNSLHRFETIPSLGKQVLVDKKASTQSISYSPTLCDKSSPPGVSKKPKRRGLQLTPPPVQVDERVTIRTLSLPLADKSFPPEVSKKPDKPMRICSLSTPPTAPKRSSSISTTQGERCSLKEQVHFVSGKDKLSDIVDCSSTNKSEQQSTSRESKVLPPSSPRDGANGGRKIRSILSTSQLRPDKIDQKNLLKPRDRIRSILVSDPIEDGEDNFEDNYGSSYNASLMKISRGDMQKHAIAVMTPTVPSNSPQISQTQSGFDPNKDYNQEVTGHSPVKIKEQLIPQKRFRSYTSPFDSQRESSNDIGRTETSQLDLSNPIARAYRQHLVTRMEQDKQLGSLANPLQVGSRVSKSTQMLDQIDSPQMTSTVLSKSSLKLDMPNSACYPHILSPMNSKSTTPASTLTFPTNDRKENITPVMQLQPGVSTINTQKLQKRESQIDCSSHSILDSVKFFEQAQYVDGKDSSQVGASSGQSYGTLPYSHRYQQHYASTDLVTKGGKGMRKRAKSTSNLMIPSGEVDEGQSSTPQQSHSSLSSNCSHKLCPSQCPQDLDGMEELDKRKMNPDGFIFSDYVSYHSAKFPKRVQIIKGICSNSTKATLSQGEVFDLHFVHQTKSVMMTDSNQIQYIVPMNTLAMFSILYDPFSVEKVANLGFHFKTAGAVMDLKNPPTIMASTQIIDGGTSESSLEKGEILILQGVKNVFHGRLLKVFSVKTNSIKFLDDQCTADFTTNPAMIKMTLPQIYDCSIPLPQKTILYPSNAMENLIPNSLQANALMKFTVSKFVVATAYPYIEMSSSSECSTLDLDVSLDIHIQEVLAVEGEHEKMQQVTQKLVNNFDDRGVNPYLNMPRPSLHRVQFALLTNLDSKSTEYNTEIVPPNGITLPKPQKDTQNSTFNSGSKSKHVPDCGMEQRMKMIEVQQVKIETEVSSICDRLDNISCKMDKIHTYLSKAQLAMTEHKRKEGYMDQPFPNSIGENLPISSDSSRFGVSLTSSLSEESSIASPLSQSKTVLEQGKAISKLHDRTSCRSLDGNFDEVFVAKAAKRSILPKPKKFKEKTEEQTTTSFPLSQKDNEPTEMKEPVKISKEEKENSGSTSDTTTHSASPKKSWIASVNLSEYLPPESSAKKTDRPIVNQIHCSSVQRQSSEESKFGEDLRGNIDNTDWYSQVEDELDKLYNDSFLSLQ